MTTYFIAPAQSPRDRYAAGFDANTFTSRREAHLAIESLTETCGGEWVVSEEPTETVTADGTLEARFKRVAILVDDVVIGDGRTGDEARADVDETCIPEGYEGHERVAEIYDARTHEVGMGPDGYVVVRARSEVRS